MGLLDGKICLKYKCYNCCIETEMPLTLEDIIRIRGLGYDVRDFAVFRDGLWRLKNINGKCVFLNDEGLCIIYPNRPLGCRLYPVIQVDDHCVPDFECCPYARYLSVEELISVCPLVKKLNKKLDKQRRSRKYRNLYIEK